MPIFPSSLQFANGEDIEAFVIEIIESMYKQKEKTGDDFYDTNVFNQIRDEQSANPRSKRVDLNNIEKIKSIIGSNARQVLLIR